MTDYSLLKEIYSTVIQLNMKILLIFSTNGNMK